MRIVGYVRVSVDREAERGLGLEVQRRAIRHWCYANGHRLIGLEEDTGLRGADDIANREALPAVLGALRDRRADAVVLLQLDRLSRDPAAQEAILAAIWRVGGRCFATESGEVDRDRTDGSTRAAIRRAMEIHGDLERRMFVQRLSAGRRRKAEAGGYAGFGSPEFGFRSSSGRLMVDADEQAALTRIQELYADGRSLRAIAGALTREGFRPRRSDHWHPQTVARIVSRL